MVPTKFYLVLISAILVAPVTSRAAATDAGTLVIYRPAAFNGWARNTIVTLDGKTVATLHSCTYVKIKVAAGNHMVEFVHTPWLGDTEAAKIPARFGFDLAAAGTQYLGYHPNEMSNSDLRETFIDYTQRKGKQPIYLGSVHEAVATRNIVDCSRVESVFN